MPEFDKDVFELMMEKVIIGEKEDDGENNPRVITFILKSGNKIKCKEDRNSNVEKNSILQNDKNQHSSYEASQNYLQTVCEPCRMRGSATTKIRHVILDFDMVSEIITFENKGKTDDELTKIDVKIQNETVWLSQQQMVELFSISRTIEKAKKEINLLTNYLEEKEKLNKTFDFWKYTALARAYTMLGNKEKSEYYKNK